jgi:hypothetical protein
MSNKVKVSADEFLKKIIEEKKRGSKAIRLDEYKEGIMQLLDAGVSRTNILQWLKSNKIVTSLQTLNAYLEKNIDVIVSKGIVFNRSIADGTYKHEKEINKLFVSIDDYEEDQWVLEFVKQHNILIRSDVSYNGKTRFRFNNRFGELVDSILSEEYHDEKFKQLYSFCINLILFTRHSIYINYSALSYENTLFSIESLDESKAQMYIHEYNDILTSTIMILCNSEKSKNSSLIDENIIDETIEKINTLFSKKYFKSFE